MPYKSTNWFLHDGKIGDLCEAAIRIVTVEVEVQQQLYEQMLAYVYINQRRISDLVLTSSSSPPYIILVFKEKLEKISLEELVGQPTQQTIKTLE